MDDMACPFNFVRKFAKREAKEKDKNTIKSEITKDGILFPDSCNFERASHSTQTHRQLSPCSRHSDPYIPRSALAC